jgi:xanthine phosphoribosyltransferase
MIKIYTDGDLNMELLKERIRRDGKIKDGHIIKVDSFLNHQIDIALLDEMGKEFYRLFSEEKITKVITIEASGIAVACLTAKYFNVPVVFAKKSESKNLDGDVYRTTVTSYTRGRDYTVILEKRFLTSDDRILIIDDILATGKAQYGLLDISEQAGAAVAGIGIVIEKGFQGGGDQLRKKGYNVQSLAIIDSMEEQTLVFRD